MFRSKPTSKDDAIKRLKEILEQDRKVVKEALKEETLRQAS